RKPMRARLISPLHGASAVPPRPGGTTDPDTIASWTMDIDPSAKLTFNGINARSGTYLFEPMTTAQLAEVAKGNTLEHARDDKDHLAELEFRHRNKDAAHFGVKQGIDASKLEQAGWGVMFPAVAANSDEARRQAAIVEALSPLLELRKSQATRIKEHYYKEYRGALGY